MCSNCIFSAILITGGGRGFYTDDSVEVFLPSTSTSCELPRLLVGRHGHTQDGLIACGGDGGADSSAETSCEEFSPTTGTWARTGHTLQEWREDHVSWSVEEGTLLMGGYFSDTTEIVKHDGTTETSFDMKYHTEYEMKLSFLSAKQTCRS